MNLRFSATLLAASLTLGSPGNIFLALASSLAAWSRSPRSVRERTRESTLVKTLAISPATSLSIGSSGKIALAVDSSLAAWARSPSSRHLRAASIAARKSLSLEDRSEITTDNITPAITATTAAADRPRTRRTCRLFFSSASASCSLSIRSIMSMASTTVTPRAAASARSRRCSWALSFHF